MTALPRQLRPDTYMPAIVGTVALAAVIAARGVGADALDETVHAAVAILFFMLVLQMHLMVRAALARRYGMRRLPVGATESTPT